MSNLRVVGWRSLRVEGQKAYEVLFSAYEMHPRNRLRLVHLLSHDGIDDIDCMSPQKQEFCVPIRDDLDHQLREARFATRVWIGHQNDLGAAIPSRHAKRPTSKWAPVPSGV